MTISRRGFLGQCAAGALGGIALAAAARRRALAIGPGAKFRFGDLSLGEAPPRPTALARLGWEVDVRTSVDVAREYSVATSLGSEKLFETPFLYLSGTKRFAPPSAKEVENLRRFLSFGGFLLVDSAEGRAGGEFDAAVRSLASELFPAPAPGFAPLGDDHVIFKSFYLISSIAGRVAVAPQLEAVTHDGRAVIVYSQNDLGGAWAKDNFGNYQYPCYPGGEGQREHAFRLGINLVMYALCLDYKTDQVHVPFILKRRRWRTER
jgi:uncharacterized protein DUF4159